jgi:CRISPR/Cas system CMR subunit Cmr4 (Cas7 group RAMP superfamily)
MRKLIEKEPSYYRINLGSNNLIYLSHAITPKEFEIEEISIKDIVKKIDELVEISNALEKTIQNINTATEIKNLQEENKLLNEKIIVLGDEIAKSIAKIEALNSTTL